eukprot:TRINITY_DN6958_c1_g2_i1.p1 TRINITY_DN6958_c1_g2~~TRINITY_DN6958_c1_g2_i1.p1  ORF type:complete len:1003 (-),score=238.67 TRINITY_DN6958_c1_g2_i1:126-2999(-)
MENIAFYIKACWQLGVPSSKLFVISDLHRKQNKSQVLSNLLALAEIANNIPTYKGPKFSADSSSAVRLSTGSSKPESAGAASNATSSELTARVAAYEEEINVLKAQLQQSTNSLAQQLAVREEIEKQRLEKDEKEKALLGETIKQLKKQNDELIAKNKIAADEQKRLYAKFVEIAQKSNKELSNNPSEVLDHVQSILFPNSVPPEKSGNNNSSSNSNKAKATTDQPVTNSPRKNTASDTNDSNFKELQVKLQEADQDIQARERRITILEQEALMLRDSSRLSEGMRKSQRTFLTQWPSKASQQDQDPDMKVDRESLEQMNLMIARILYNSSSVSFDDVTNLAHIFALDYCRRQFAFGLKQIIDQNAALSLLSTQSFELILFLMHMVLQEVDKCSTKDYISARMMMHASSRLYREVDNGTGTWEKEFISEYIKSFTIWKNIGFWEDYFCEVLSKKNRQSVRLQGRGNQIVKQGNAVSIMSLDNEVVSNLLTSFAHEMTLWSVETTDVRKFVTDMCLSNKVDPKTQNELLRKIEASVQDDKQRQKKAMKMVQSIQKKADKKIKAKNSAKKKESPTPPSSDKGLSVKFGTLVSGVPRRIKAHAATSQTTGVAKGQSIRAALEVEVVPDDVADQESRVVCPEGVLCKSTDPDHFRAYRHTTPQPTIATTHGSAPSPSPMNKAINTNNSNINATWTRSRAQTPTRRLPVTPVSIASGKFDTSALTSSEYDTDLSYSDDDDGDDGNDDFNDEQDESMGLLGHAKNKHNARVDSLREDEIPDFNTLKRQTPLRGALYETLILLSSPGSPAQASPSVTHTQQSSTTTSTPPVAKADQATNLRLTTLTPPQSPKPTLSSPKPTPASPLPQHTPLKPAITLPVKSSSLKASSTTKTAITTATTTSPTTSTTTTTSPTTSTTTSPAVRRSGTLPSQTSNVVSREGAADPQGHTHRFGEAKARFSATTK